VPALSDGLKVQEYARSYGTDVAGLLFNKVGEGDTVERVADQVERHFEGPVLAAVPEDDAAGAARRAGEPLLASAPDSPAAAAFRSAADALDVRAGDADAVAERFRNAVVPERP
jgi:septum site-determining protein MinD